MRVAVGVVLGIFGAALLLLPAHLVRAEQQINSAIVGQRAGRVLTRIQFAMVGAMLLVAGVLLAFRRG